MNDVNLVDLSELDLYYRVNPNIPFNKDKNTFVRYLKDLREYDRNFISKPSNIVYYFMNSLALLIFGFFVFVFYGEALSQIIKVFQNTYQITDHNALLALGIPRLFVVPVSIFSFLLAGSIMLLAEIFFILSLVLGVNRKWTKYHGQLLVLAEKLQEKEVLEEFFIYQKEKKAFQLVQMSINWEMEYTYPFLFKNFPPYFHAFGELSLYVFSLISFILPTIVSITIFNVPMLIILIFLVSLFFILVSSRAQKTIQLYRQIKNLQNRLIVQQEMKLVELICESTQDPLLVHVNRENLHRLVHERSIPTTFPLLPLSMILSIFSAIIGYVILAMENAP
ncbi:MAG: hypothetical protein ACXADW_08345 [Candidatus Hodarchaeales archaeon]|jgi:hypothetical protein